MTLVFTLCSNNYLPQAITLGQSLEIFNPLYSFKIGLVDKRNSEIDYSSIPFEIIEVDRIGISSFSEMFKRYDITELNTAVKPFYFKYFIENYSSADNFIYLDPDILVYQPFTGLEEILQRKEIVITPHFTTPIEDDKILDETDILNSGLYNLGFIALRRGAESRKFVEWWSRRLETRAHINFTKGMFTDQLWINFVPLYFDNVYILTLPGYNMAYWNLHERRISATNNVLFKDEKYPLVFFHFSGYNPLQPDILSKYQDRFTFENRKDVVGLFKEYAKLLFCNGFNKFNQYPCYYAVEKQKLDLDAYLAYKKSIPIYKRIFRGFILRLIKISKINIDYYTH